MRTNLEKEILNTMSKDPSNWKWMLFYFNRKDPRLMVPKYKSSTGWTLNFASPYSYLFLIAVALILIAFRFLK